MIRRDRLLVGATIAAALGIATLFGAAIWYILNQSLTKEEERVELLARSLGRDVENMFVESLDMLTELNELDEDSCSEAHLDAMQSAAISQTQIRAIGYWRGTDRLCGVGFIRGNELTPSKADRIYGSGVIAWWPGPQTEFGGVQFFLMRYGAHDVVIDPRELIDSGAIDGRKAGLWVEGLKMSTHPWGVELPDPDSVPEGLSVDQANGRVISNFALGTVLPIEIVVVEPLDSLWHRYLPTISIAGMLGGLLVACWIYLVVVFSRRQLGLGAELREAISAGHLEVLYQPIVSLDERRCVGAEALVRWRHEDGSLVSPDFFIPVAEKAGLISDVTGLVLREILNGLGDLIRAHPGIHINLNLARQDLEHPELFTILSEALERANVPASVIKLEITERALINSDAARNMIRQLRKLGHQIAIDDFGTGYSSLSYLETFEIDTLKIDKAFVDAIEKDAVTSSVITHVIEMAHSLKLDTVAEGVEEEHQAQWLREHGVTHGQGFHFSTPLSAAAFGRFYRRYAVTVV